MHTLLRSITGNASLSVWSVGLDELLLVLASTAQLLTEMSTRNIKIIMFLESKVRRVLRADNLTALPYITYINSVRTSQETTLLRFAARNSDF
jgi:hypothetical protein